MKVVYIASPYTIGDKLTNVKRQVRAFSALLNKGYAPIAPLLAHYIDVEYPQDYLTWLKLDFEFISRSDILVRLPGESSGADKEVEYAKKMEIPVIMCSNDDCIEVEEYKENNEPI